MESLLCRVCLSSNSLEYVEMEAFSNKMTYFECFNACTQLSAKSGDDLTSVLCSKCANRLENAYLFIMEAREADEILRNRLNGFFNDSNHIEIITAENGSFNDEDIENMEIVVLKPLEAEDTVESTILEEKVQDIHRTYVLDEYTLCSGENPDDLVIEIAEKNEKTYQEPMNRRKKHSSFKCLDCSKDFRTQKSLERHLKLSHKIVHDEANQQNVSANEEILNKHEQLHHSSINTILSKAYSENSSQNSPARLESLIEETFYDDLAENIIEQCETENSDDDNVKAENSDHSSATVLKECTLCKKRLLERNMERHLKSHHNTSSVQQDFSCTYCQRHFKSQKSLRQHEKTHLEQTENIACADCGRQYCTMSLLEQHRRNTHKEREFACGICGNAFKLRNQLTNHMKLHLEKNIQCPHCEKKYARNFDLKVHLRTHTGEMPFQCEICDKRFAIKVRLTYHLQKHYGIKHTCKECGKEFNSKQKLKGHSFKHTGMPYRCELCDHGFPNRDVFKRHLLRVHQATITEEALLEMFQRYTGKATRIREINVSMDTDLETGEENSMLDNKDNDQTVVMLNEMNK